MSTFDTIHNNKNDPKTSYLNTLLGSAVFYWACLGFLALCLMAYLLISWISSPYFQPSPVGDTPIPQAQLYLIRFIEFVSAGIAFAIVMKYIVIPLINQRTLTWDAMYIIALFTLYWTDPMDNYVHTSFFYNAYTLNMGSWATFIPGFGAVNSQLFPEPLLLMGSLFIWFNFGAAVLSCKIIDAIKHRYPNARMLTILAGLFLAFFITDMIIEGSFMWSGIMAYAGVVQSLSLWPGQPHQFPLYEPFIVAFTWLCFTCFRYFRDDKGLSFAERGLEKLNLKGKKRKLVSLLAITGFLNIVYTLPYYMSYNAFAIQADTIPPYPSYMRAGMCGQGTEYACPSKQYVPIPRKGMALYIKPDDPRLPLEIRLSQDGPPYGWFSGN